MLSQRVKAAVIFVPLVLFLIYIGGWTFKWFITLILLLAALEYTRLFAKQSHKPPLAIVLTGVFLMLLPRLVFGQEAFEWVLLGVILLTAITTFIQYEQGKKNAALLFTISFAGIIYIGWVGGFLIALREQPNGLGWMLTALPVTWLADSGAYFIGRWLGKRKLAPHLSPGKTWAGIYGAVITGTLSGLLLTLLWRAVGWLPAETPLWQGALMGFVLAILTPVGDLLISLFKRAADVKDTGNIIPGHGGILDRIDTWIWAAMLGYFIVQLF